MPSSWLRARIPRVWALWAASRPSQLALIVLLYFLGVGMAAVGPPFVAREPALNAPQDVLEPSMAATLALGAGSLLLIAAGVHYANEYADADTDALTERTPFSGGSGALVETGLPPTFLRSASAFASLFGVGVGLSGVAVGALPVTAIGLLGVGLVGGLAYSLPPAALVRRGLGEPVNMALGGVLLPVYGVAVVAMPTIYAPLAVLPFTLVVGCNLIAIHWPDRAADDDVGKRTVAVRWPPARLRRSYATLGVLALVGAVGLWTIGTLPTAVALAHAATVPFLAWGRTTIARQRTPLPAVAAMVSLAAATTVGWWWVGLS